ncbi:cupin domain-containing protein [Stappia sp.]|uniref:cupin domain-containing protein n=1 Tax=Stappia sp. TaxID=1870903 RepID=UPI0032D8F12A
MALQDTTPIMRTAAAPSAVALPGLAHAVPTTLPLAPAPIDPDWILEGAPQARAAQIAHAADGRATLSVWDCTRGRFHWYFGGDEAVHILDGAVNVTGPDGRTRHLVAGDAAWFPAGTWFEWDVPEYVRKVAFCHDPVPAVARLPLRVWGRLGRIAARVLRGRRTRAPGGRTPA